MTDWEKQLRRRAATVERAKEALNIDIAGARLDGHSFREIGTWADVNHERARTIAIRINGDSTAVDAPYFTTETSDYYHSTAGCSGWRRGRAAGDERHPILPLTEEQASAAPQKPCPECVIPADHPDPQEQP